MFMCQGKLMMQVSDLHNVWGPEIKERRWLANVSLLPATGSCDMGKRGRIAEAPGSIEIAH